MYLIHKHLIFLIKKTDMVSEEKTKGESTNIQNKKKDILSTIYKYLLHKIIYGGITGIGK